MPWQELAFRTGASLVGISVTVWLYVHALRFVGLHFGGALKVAVSLLVYLLVAAAIGAGLLYVLGSAADTATRQTVPYMLCVLLSWGIVSAPGIIYLRRQLPMLRAMGYFSPK